MTTPDTPLYLAPVLSTPPQQLTSMRPPLSMTITSPSLAASIALTPMWVVDLVSPAATTFIVTASPMIFSQPSYILLTP